MSDRYTFRPIKALKSVAAVGHALVGTAQASMEHLRASSKMYQLGDEFVSRIAADGNAHTLFEDQPSMYWHAHVRAVRELERMALEGMRADRVRLRPVDPLHDAKIEDDTRKSMDVRLTAIDWMVTIHRP